MSIERLATISVLENYISEEAHAQGGDAKLMLQAREVDLILEILAKEKEEILEK